MVKDTKGYVFGGYLSVSWTGSGGVTTNPNAEKKDPNAWLFALKNFAKIAPTKLPFKRTQADLVITIILIMGRISTMEL